MPKRRRSRRTNINRFWQLRASTPFTLIIIGLMGASFFGSRVYSAHALKSAKSFSSSVPVVTLADRALPRSEPTHITIPAVGINAGIVSVGLDASGSIQMPPLFDWTTGWYKYSPTPGQIGPSIIVGHVDTYKGISVFWRLRDVQKGDIINITRTDGSTAKFKVQSMRQFDQHNFPTKEVYGNIRYPGLRLITCGGTFDTQTKSYTQNTVVYAFITV